MPRRYAAALLIMLASLSRAEESWTLHVREVVDFVLAQETPQGCIPDAPAGLRANQDGAMERSLLAVAHGFRTTSRPTYRTALRDAIKWLAICMEKNDKFWAGTWRFAYSSKPPYLALPTSPDGKAQDARGLSSTSALFVYLVAVYTDFTGDDSLSRSLRPHVHRALDFLLERNRGPNGLFYRGWYQNPTSGNWELCRRQLAADQADVYLGLLAGYWLTEQPRLKLAADKLERELPRLLYHKNQKAFGTALDDAGNLLPPIDEPETCFVQGYLSWVFGPTRETEKAMEWLRDRLAPDGSFRKNKTETAYVLPVAGFCLGASRLGLYPNQLRQARKWLREVAVTSRGAVREYADLNAPTRNDLAGWVIPAWLSSHPHRFDRIPGRPADPQDQVPPTQPPPPKPTTATPTSK